MVKRSSPESRLPVYDLAGADRRLRNEEAIAVHDFAVDVGKIDGRLFEPENRDVAAQMEQAAANIKVAEAGLEQAQAELREAERQLKGWSRAKKLP